MPLPKKISPNPIVTSTVELRITSPLTTHEIFSKVFPAVSSILPKVESKNLPNEVKIQVNPAQFKYIPDFTFKNTDYSLSINENVISFSNINEYTLWSSYFPFIKSILQPLFSLNYFTSIARIGVRYASLFNNVGSIEEMLNFVPSSPIEGYDQKFDQFRAHYKVKDYNLYVQLAANAVAIVNKKQVNGTVIDIDASYTSSLVPDENIYKIIDDLHTEEKIFFFEKLLNAEFIKTLKPEY